MEPIEKVTGYTQCSSLPPVCVTLIAVLIDLLQGVAVQ